MHDLTSTATELKLRMDKLLMQPFYVGVIIHPHSKFDTD